MSVGFDYLGTTTDRCDNSMQLIQIVRSSDDESENKAKLRRPLLFILAAVVVAATACAIYLADFYPADAEAIGAFAVDNAVEMRTEESGDLIWAPEGASRGLIFYPGGKVEHTAYIPMMEELSSRGILCVVVEMPFHLAVLDINGAEGIREQFPQIEDWYIGVLSQDGLYDLLGLIDTQGFSEYN